MYPDYYNIYNQYYVPYEQNYRNNVPQPYNEEIITLNQVITLIKQSVRDEKEDEMFYETLIRSGTYRKRKKYYKKY